MQMDLNMNIASVGVGRATTRSSGKFSQMNGEDEMEQEQDQRKQNFVSVIKRNPNILSDTAQKKRPSTNDNNDNPNSELPIPRDKKRKELGTTIDQSDLRPTVTKTENKTNSNSKALQRINSTSTNESPIKVKPNDDGPTKNKVTKLNDQRNPNSTCVAKPSTRTPLKKQSQSQTSVKLNSDKSGSSDLELETPIVLAEKLLSVPANHSTPIQKSVQEAATISGSYSSASTASLHESSQSEPESESVSTEIADTDTRSKSSLLGPETPIAMTIACLEKQEEPWGLKIESTFTINLGLGLESSNLKVEERPGPGTQNIDTVDKVDVDLESMPVLELQVPFPRATATEVTYVPETVGLSNVKVAHIFIGSGIHSHSHINQRNGMFECTACNRTFKTKANIKYHASCGGDSDTLLKCELCGQGFKNNTHYKYHLSTHSGERPFGCAECGQSFIQKSKLLRHISLVHKGQRLFDCPDCQKKLASAQLLRNHLRTHSGEKPFVCAICKKGFTTPANLARHKSQHEDGRTRYSCRHCDKTLSSKHSISMHERIHTGVRDFICGLCGLDFFNSKDLQRHFSDRHKHERPYICTICNSSQKRLDNLNRHLRKCHKVADDEIKARKYCRIELETESGSVDLEILDCEASRSVTNAVEVEVEVESPVQVKHAQIRTEDHCESETQNEESVAVLGNLGDIEPVPSVTDNTSTSTNTLIVIDHIHMEELSDKQVQDVAGLAIPTLIDIGANTSFVNAEITLENEGDDNEAENMDESDNSEPEFIDLEEEIQLKDIKEDDNNTNTNANISIDIDKNKELNNSGHVEIGTGGDPLNLDLDTDPSSANENDVENSAENGSAAAANQKLDEVEIDSTNTTANTTNASKKPGNQAEAEWTKALHEQVQAKDKDKENFTFEYKGETIEYDPNCRKIVQKRLWYEAAERVQEALMLLPEADRLEWTRKEKAYENWMKGTEGSTNPYKG